MTSPILTGVNTMISRDLRRRRLTSIWDHPFRAIWLALAGLVITSLPAWAEEPVTATKPVLHLAGGAFTTGELKDCDRPSTLRWQATHFVTPFDFDLKAVNAVHYPSPAVLPRPAGDYCFELSGGDVLHGSLVDLDATQAVLEVPNLGRLHVDRSKLARIDRWKDGADLLYLGPNGLTGWNKVAEPKPVTPPVNRGLVIFNNGGAVAPRPQPEKNPEPEANPWREDSGHLFTNVPGAALQGDFTLPARASIEFEVSWKSKPDFVLAFGVDGDEKSVDQAFRFEVWEGELVVLRETEKEADIASVQAIEPGPGRAHPHVYIDQEAGRILVFSSKWKVLADLKVVAPRNKPLSGVYIANKSGDVRLEQLRIGRWNGEPPRELDSGKSRIHRADGSIVYGEVTRYDAETKEYVLREATGESRIAESAIASVLLSQPADDPSRTFRAVYQDGSRVGGELLKVEKGELWVSSQGIKETLRLPSAGLRSLVTLRKDGTTAASSEAPPASAPIESKPMGDNVIVFRAAGGVDFKHFAVNLVPAAPAVADVAVAPPPPPAEPAPAAAKAAVAKGAVAKAAVAPPPAAPAPPPAVALVAAAPAPAPAANMAGFMRVRAVDMPTPAPAPTADRAPASASKEDGSGVLEMDGLRLPGKLVNATEAAGSSCLSWLPAGSLNASSLRAGVSGRIVYRTPPPTTTTVQVANGNMRVIQRIQPLQPAQPAAVPLARNFLNFAFGGAPPEPESKQDGRRSLYLRSGDIIPSTVTKIDENGVWFKTSMSESTFVAHDKVKAVELAQSAAPTIRLSKTKRERLLTLPRMQKDAPPTQLIRSTNGDYLRGRIVEMDDKMLRVEVRLETKDVPRSRIARIIWLHPDELDASKAVPPPERAGSTRVQALRSDGIRLTFFADQFADKALVGKSDVLGACRVALADVDQLLFGKEIDRAASQLVYQQWKLKNAVMPREASADGGSGSAGTESALVGKAAPDFKLSLLNNPKAFRLSEHKGKVVVLDFWATWCGPCLQAMPQVDKVTREFKDQGVEFVAVNLQEAPKAITAMLERHKLDMTVALDIDGAVAQKYAANAIPQTVIIDRDGTVARLFVGGGPHFDDQLREALKAVLSGAKDEAKPAAEKP
jgi:thiol-disulfide isomerase/thioredoxin